MRMLLRAGLAVVLVTMALRGGGEAVAKPLVIEAVDIAVKIKKPEIPIFMNRENLNTDYRLELKESFLPKIVESVEKKPF